MMAHDAQKNIELVADDLGVDPDALKETLSDLKVELASVGEFRANYVSAQHYAFLRGVKSTGKFLSGHDDYSEHAAAVDESQQLVTTAGKIADFERTKIGKAFRTLIYRGN